MTTEGTNRLSEIVEYLGANPTPPAGASDGQHVIHLHEHHHYAPPAPPPPPPKATFVEQLPAYLVLALVAMVVATVCAAVLAVIGIILIAVMVGLAVVIALLAYLVRSMSENTAVKALADQGKRSSDRTRSRHPHQG